jgi:hypothetical protein
METYTKDPDAVLDYEIDWSAWLGEDTITASTFTVDTGLTEDSESNDTTAATVWLSGGTVGARYLVTNHITTAAGRQNDRSFYIYVKEQ